MEAGPEAPRAPTVPFAGPPALELPHDASGGSYGWADQGRRRPSKQTLIVAAIVTLMVAGLAFMIIATSAGAGVAGGCGGG